MCTWDAENRLTSVAPGAGTEEAGDQKVAFTYDYLGRRVAKRVYEWDNALVRTAGIVSSGACAYALWLKIRRVQARGIYVAGLLGVLLAFLLLTAW